MKLDLSKFRKIHEGKTSATLVHPAGHQIILSKQALEKNHRRDLASLPMKMADGGEVDDEDQFVDSIASPDAEENRNETGLASRPPTEEEAQKEKQDRYFPGGTFNEKNAILDMPGDRPEIVQSQSKILGQANEARDAEGKAKSQSALDDYKDHLEAVQLYNKEAKKSGLPEKDLPEPPTPEKAINQNPYLTSEAPIAAAPAEPMNNPNQAPYKGLPGLQNQGLYGQGVNNQIAANTEAGRIESEGARRSAEAYKQAENEQQTDNDNFQKNTRRFQQDHAAFMNDLQNKHIDPDRYLKNKGVGGNIMTAIGLLLGGFAPATGENSAVKMLTQNIDRDIEAQKQDINTADKLMQANMHYYGNLRQAAEATRLQKYQMLSYKINEIAQQSQDPLAIQRAKAANSIIEQNIGLQQNAQILRQTLIDKMNGNQGESGSSSGSNPAANLFSLKQANVIDKDDYNESMKELKLKQQDEGLRDMAIKSFDNIHGQFMNGLLSPADVSSAKQTFIGRIIKETEGRYNFEAAQNLADAVFSRIMESGSTSSKKRERIVDLFSTNSYPHLEALGMTSGRKMTKIQESAPRTE